MLTRNRPNNAEKIYFNSMSKTYLDGSKQILFATKRVFRKPGWEEIKVDVSKPNSYDLVNEADEILWRAWVRENVYGLSATESWIPSKFLDECGWPLNWREMPVEEMTVGMLAQLDEEERLKPLTNLRRSMRRARVKVRDYALSTAMVYFVTFTLDATKIDRRDIHVITKKLNRWLDNMVRRKGLCYLMVPELHKDGAIHFHGLINDALDVVDSGTVIPPGIDPATNKRYKPKRPINDRQRGYWLSHGGRIVYNLPDWPYGFTTALKLEVCYEQAVNYVCKYISKGLDEANPDTLPTKVGGRWYYSGGDLGKPDVAFFNSNMEDIEEEFGEAARRVRVRDLTDVEMIVVWIDANGVPRVRPQNARTSGGCKAK